MATTPDPDAMQFGNNLPAKQHNFWRTMKPIEQAAATILGWTPSSWEEGTHALSLPSAMILDDLNEQQKIAVQILGYKDTEWDRDVNQWNSNLQVYTERAQAREAWERSSVSNTMLHCMQQFESLSHDELNNRKDDTSTTSTSNPTTPERIRSTSSPIPPQIQRQNAYNRNEEVDAEVPCP